MSGIVSYGAYIPMGRRPLGGGREQAVAGEDEDSVTMAVAAAADCLRGIDRATVDGVMFASTSSPYAEKQVASLVARALDLRRDLMTADYGGSLRAGMSALRGALDAVGAGSAHRVLVVASDCRRAAPGSPLDSQLGDGAAAFVVASSGALAAVEASYAVADEILAVWRRAGEPFVESWEERFVLEHGYQRTLAEAVQGLCAKSGHAPGDFDRVVLYGPDARAHAALARALRLAPERIQDPLFGKVGNTGAAFVPLLLAAALETAAAGQHILAAASGDGAEAVSLHVLERGENPHPPRGASFYLRRRRALAAEGAHPRSRERQAGGGGISATTHFRDRDDDISFKAQSCKKCRTLQFPTQRVCYGCRAKDSFERVRLSDRRGRLLSYTFDHFHPALEPPTIAGVVEVEGGCRVYLMMTDCDPGEVRCDLPVEFVFRKIHEAGGKPNYFWKSTPIREDA